MRSPFRFALVLFALVLPAALAGCGGDNHAGTAPAPQPKSAAAARASEITLAGLRSEYTITATQDGYTVAGNGSTAQYPAGTRLRFDDQLTALDANGSPGSLYRLYRAAFDRAPDLQGLGYWIGRADGGMGLDDVARQFIASEEFTRLYGDMPDNKRFLTLLYNNVLHRAPDDEGLKFWSAAIAAGVTRASVLAGFSESAENRLQTADATRLGIAYLPPHATGIFLLAGSGITAGNTDGKGDAARFWNPGGLAMGPDGVIYLADQTNSLIRKVTPDGAVTTLAANDDSARPATSFVIGVDGAGYVYVTNESDHTVRRISPIGQAQRFAGQPGQAGGEDGAAGTARFDAPTGVAADRAGNVYVFSGNTVRKISPGGSVTTLAGQYGQSGSSDGTGPLARFSRRAQLAVDASGNVYVAERSVLRKVSPTGVVTTIAGGANYSGDQDGPGGAFSNVRGIALDNAGNVYLADARQVRKVTPAGVVSTLAGAWQTGAGTFDDGPGTSIRFEAVNGVAVDAAGTIYLSESNDTIRTLGTDGQVRTLAGRSTFVPAQVDGPVEEARFGFVNGLAITPDRRIIVSDSATVRSVAPDGHVRTLGGNQWSRGIVDGPLRDARFNRAGAMAVDPAGNIYMLDSDQIRRLGVDGNVDTLVRNLETALDLDWSPASGRLVVASWFNTVLEMVPSGSDYAMRPLAGMPEPTMNPFNLAADRAGNVYIADGEHHVIRKLAADGSLTIVAGRYDRRAAADGSGDQSLLSNPSGLAIDSVGNLYIADLGNHVIRKLTPDGTLSTVAGTFGKGRLRPGMSNGRLHAPGSIKLMDDKTLIVGCGPNVVRIALP